MVNCHTLLFNKVYCCVKLVEYIHCRKIHSLHIFLRQSHQLYCPNISLLSNILYPRHIFKFGMSCCHAVDGISTLIQISSTRQFVVHCYISIDFLKNNKANTLGEYQ